MKENNLLQRFLKEGLCQNYWGWFHALAGGLAFVLLTKWFGLSAISAFITVLLVSIMWEVVEYINLKFNGGMSQNYGEVNRFYLDAAGDILLALATILLIILG